jgi:hypothetical protein
VSAANQEQTTSQPQSKPIPQSNPIVNTNPVNNPSTTTSTITDNNNDNSQSQSSGGSTGSSSSDEQSTSEDKNKFSDKNLGAETRFIIVQQDNEKVGLFQIISNEDNMSVNVLPKTIRPIEEFDSTTKALSWINDYDNRN